MAQQQLLERRVSERIFLDSLIQSNLKLEQKIAEFRRNTESEKDAILQEKLAELKRQTQADRNGEPTTVEIPEEVLEKNIRNERDSGVIHLDDIFKTTNIYSFCLFHISVVYSWREKPDPVKSIEEWLNMESTLNLFKCQVLNFLEMTEHKIAVINITKEEWKRCVTDNLDSAKTLWSWHEHAAVGMLMHHSNLGKMGRPLMQSYSRPQHSVLTPQEKVRNHWSNVFEQQREKHINKRTDKQQQQQQQQQQ